MTLSIKSVFAMLKETFKDFSDDNCTRLAAALSYYTIFSLPALLVIVVTIVGAVWGQDAATGQINQQVESLVGKDSAQQVQTMITNARQRASGDTGLIASLIGIGALLFGATGAFMELQNALNTAWEVQPDPEKGGIKNFVFKRLLSFGMILGIGFLLLVSLAVSAAVSAFGNMLAQWLPAFFSGPLLYILNFAVSLLVITLLFAAIFKILPDAIIRWKDVWVGAVFTALLFVIGKFLIGFYLGQSDVGSTYGAAGSLALILIWVYYSAIIIFLGAEFTQVYAKHTGSLILPDADAVRVVTERRHIRDDAGAFDESTEPIRHSQGERQSESRLR